MQMKKFIIIIIFMFCLMLNQVFAELLENDSLNQINNSTALGVAGLNLDYKEFFSPSDMKNTIANYGTVPKSAESGTIPGIFFDIRTTFWKKIYASLYLDYYGGRLKYDGGDYKGAHVKKQQRQFFDAELKPGYIFTLNFTKGYVLQTIPYVGVGYRYWDREEGTTETYQNFKTIAGIRFNLQLADDFIFSPYIEGGKIFGARMKSDEPYVINYTSVSNSSSSNSKLMDSSATLGNKPIYTGGLELTYKVSDEFFLNSFVSYTRFRYGKSESVINEDGNNWHEPDSKTDELKFGLGVRYSWLL